ncbi:hypothetical protein ACOMHN_044190 [Nucella lapillus]
MGVTLALPTDSRYVLRMRRGKAPGRDLNVTLRSESSSSTHNTEIGWLVLPGFEPTTSGPSGLEVSRLNHSAMAPVWLSG